MPTSVSVILPVYNAVATVESALSSILHQTMDDFEVIVVDDGSTDGSLDVIKRVGETDDRLHILARSHEGLISALNAGIETSTGSLVARFDADDLSHPTRLEKQVSYLDAHEDVALVGTQIHCFPDNVVAEGFRVYEAWINSLIEPEDIAREIFIESPVVHPTIMVRRAILEDVGGYLDNGWAEDYDLWLRIHTAGHRMAKLPEILHEWREGDQRLTRTDARYSVENFIRAKVHYLVRGPLASEKRCIIWGAGQMGRRISKHLRRADVDIAAFVDIDPRKIGNTRRGSPIIGPDDLPQTRVEAGDPLILAAVPSRGARGLIRENLARLGYVESTDFICVA